MNDVECHKMHFHVYISLCSCIQRHALLSREFYSNAGLLVTPFCSFHSQTFQNKSQFKNYHIESFIFVRFKCQSVMAGRLCLWTLSTIVSDGWVNLGLLRNRRWSKGQLLFPGYQSDILCANLIYAVLLLQTVSMVGHGIKKIK